MLISSYCVLLPPGGTCSGQETQVTRPSGRTMPILFPESLVPSSAPERVCRRAVRPGVQVSSARHQALGLRGPEGGQGLEASLNWPSTVATLRVLNPLATGQITTHKRGLWDSVLGSRTLYHHPTGDGDSGTLPASPC